MKTIDRFELVRDSGGRISKGWRAERYAIGLMVVQHLRTGRCSVGVDDGYGNVVESPMSHVDGPYFDPGEIHNGYMS